MSCQSRFGEAGQGPKVSVVMAVFNGAQYLHQAVESILDQTFTNFELVIVDDGSTDETPHILASYRDPRIVRVENPQNLGLTRSLNRCIRASRGELIARQDADDASLPHRLAKQVAYMDAHPNVGLIGAGSVWVDARGKVIQEWRPLTDAAAIQQTLLSNIPFIHGTFMFRRKSLHDLGGGYDEAFPVAQDCDLLFRISERWEVVGLTDVLYVHRRHENTVTARRKPEQDQYLGLAQQAAIRRRQSYGWGRLRRTGRQTPEWVRSADRRWLARRFVWWSAAARGVSRMAAFQFLLIAFLMNPFTSEAWIYLAGIMSRKMHYYTRWMSGRRNRGSV